MAAAGARPSAWRVACRPRRAGCHPGGGKDRIGIARASSVDRRRTVHAGPLTGMIAQVLLIAALAGIVALSGARLSATAWVVGIACGVITNTALARGLSRYGSERLARADWVTLARASLAVGIAALVADSFEEHVPVMLLVPLAAVALALDAVDGWVARRTRTTGTLGARFDGEVDAFLILVLSVFVARSAGAWVLAIGAARYAFLAAGWPLRWLREPLPPRYWRKVVAATEGIVLAIAAADILPPRLIQGALIGALALLAESFGRDVWWLWKRRPAAEPRAEDVRARTAGALTVLALLAVWAALVAPDEPSRLTVGGFARIPLEALVVSVVAIAVPATARPVLVGLLGPTLALVVVLKILDIGFFATFDRPFDPIADSGYAGIGVETLRASVGPTEANLVVAGLVVVAAALVVVTTLAVRRLMQVAARRRRRSLASVAVLAVASVAALLFGAQFVPHTPIASTTAAALIVGKVNAVHAGIHDHTVFAKEISHDRFGDTPGGQLLTGLRGKDVVLAFVESYGRVAVQGSSFSPQVDAALAKDTRQLQAAGFSSRSAFLTSPTFGGISWLAHSTMQSGVWVNNQRRYNQLVGTNRLTLTSAFKRAGWRTVADVPANDRTWPEGSFFYGYDKVYDRRNVGYRGPSFAYAPMPDQYVLAALQRLELARARSRPVFAEVDLVSSHEPWTHVPRLVNWHALGNGSIFNSPHNRTATGARLDDARGVRAAYGRTIQYTLSALVSFVRHYGNNRLVLIVLGDHQPWTIVSGQGASHDVPVSVIAHDPAVLDRIAGWGFQSGLRPGPNA